MKYIFGFILICFTTATLFAETKTLKIQEFIESATKNDPYFEEILIDKLKIAYNKPSNLPVEDIVLNLRNNHKFFTGGNSENDLYLELKKLFPFTGTEIGFAYDNDNELQFAISQQILQDAFGKNTKIYSKILDIDNEITNYKIIEAYEDYLYSLIIIYYDWYSAFYNLKIAQSSYDQNLKLLENIKERQRQKIALDIDVNKIKLLILNKKENLISLQEKYASIINLINKSLNSQALNLEPVYPEQYKNIKVEFNRDYNQFKEKSRSYKILNLLENQSDLEVKKSLDKILPSTNLLFSYDNNDERYNRKLCMR